MLLLPKLGLVSPFMHDQEIVDKIAQDLDRVRATRIDLLPEKGSLIEVIADAMNALEVAFIMLADQAERTPPTYPQATFVPVSNSKDAKKL